MEIHRFEKVWLGAAFLLIVGLIATIAYGTVGAGVTMVNDEGGTIDVEKVANNEFGETSNFREPGVYQNAQGEYHVYVVSQQFLFRPGTNDPIRVPADAEVTFHVTSSDVVHGFQLVGTNVNTMVIPGQVATFRTRFSETGRYGIVCHEYCGAGHHTMAGNVRVVPAARVNATAVSAEGS